MNRMYVLWLGPNCWKAFLQRQGKERLLSQLREPGIQPRW
jgi:hypothetical protein